MGKRGRETEPIMRGWTSKHVRETEIHYCKSTLCHDNFKILMIKRSYNGCHHHQYVMDFFFFFLPAGCNCFFAQLEDAVHTSFMCCDLTLIRQTAGVYMKLPKISIHFLLG